MAGPSGSNGSNYTVQVNENEVEEDSVILVLENKTQKYGTMAQKQEHLARGVGHEAAIVAACPDPLNQH